MMNEEQLIIGRHTEIKPLTNRQLARQVTNEPISRMKELEGREWRLHVSAPGTGFYSYRITRTDNAGIWGVLVSDTVRELTLADVI